MFRFRILFILPALIFSSMRIETACGQSKYSSNAFGELNQFFRQEYAKSRERKLEGVDPIVIVQGDYLVLIHEGKREEGSRVNPHYHDLKSLSHVPLALFCILSDRMDAELERPTRDSLSLLQSKIKTLKKKLPEVFGQGEISDKQTELMDHSDRLIADALRAGTISRKTIKNYVKIVRPYVVGNASECAQLRISNYHEQMKKWKAKLSEKEWQRLYILIPGAVMSRKNSLAVSYFAKLFQQSSEGGRVIYAESQFDEKQDLNLLGTHLLDSEIGRVFFDDESRMKRDLLGPYANIHLDSLDYSMFRGRK